MILYTTVPSRIEQNLIHRTVTNPSAHNLDTVIVNITNQVHVRVTRIVNHHLNESTISSIIATNLL